MNVGSGSNVTRVLAPEPVTVYVPSSGIVIDDVLVHDASAVASRQIFTVLGSNVPPGLVSFAEGLNTWLVSHAPVFTSGLAVGGATTVGVIVLRAVLPAVSVTSYETRVATPVNVGSGSNTTRAEEPDPVTV